MRFSHALFVRSFVCLFVCLFVIKISQTVWMNFDYNINLMKKQQQSISLELN